MTPAVEYVVARLQPAFRFATNATFSKSWTRAEAARLHTRLWGYSEPAQWL